MQYQIFIELISPLQFYFADKPKIELPGVTHIEYHYLS